MKPPIVVKDYLEGLRLTVDGDGLLIEVTDYHTVPLRLSFSQLGELGLVSSAGPAPPAKNAPGEAQPASNVQPENGSDPA